MYKHLSHDGVQRSCVAQN